jgi:hypothetical protein
LELADAGEVNVRKQNRRTTTKRGREHGSSKSFEPGPVGFLIIIEGYESSEQIIELKIKN